MAAATWYGSVFGRRTVGVYVPSKYAVDRRPLTATKNYETARFYAGRFAIRGYHLFNRSHTLL
jgi:hypothetical protein